MEESLSGEMISWENFIYVADFFEISKLRHISLLGGEPTLHPNFVDYVLYLVNRGFHITVFTSAIVSDGLLEEFKKYLTKIPRKQLNFVCNLNNPEQTETAPSEPKRIERFLSIMGPWCMPGFNIYRTDFEIDFIFNLINRYGMHRGIRFGLSSPIPGYDNLYIPSYEIPGIINRLYSYKPIFDRFGIKPGLDCGFTMCSFNDEQLGWLQRMTMRAKFGCAPAIDITPDLNVYSCFPLSGLYKRSLFEFNSIKEIGNFYFDLHKKIRSEKSGIFDDCDDCSHQAEGRCAGGGVCHILSYFMKEAEVRLPEIENGLSKRCLS